MADHRSMLEAIGVAVDLAAEGECPDALAI